MKSVQLVIAGLGGLVAMGLASSASADAIDGNWCAEDGRHLSVQGSKVVTPGGVELQVPYDRHAMSYTVPESEPGAGEMMALRVVSDNELWVTLAVAGSEKESWRRCEFTS